MSDDTKYEGFYAPKSPESPSQNAREHAQLLEKIKIWQHKTTIWVPPRREDISPHWKWLQDPNRKRSSLSPASALESLTLDEQEQQAVEPTDYATYNSRIPLSPSVSEDGPDYRITDEMKYEGLHSLPPDCTFRRMVQLWNRYRRDHPRACGGKVLPVPEQPFRFMDLPPEVRRRVYAFLFRGLLIGETGLIAYMGDDGSAGSHRKYCYQDEPFDPEYCWQNELLDVRVFAVSKVIKTEAREVFFKENIFSIEIPEVQNGWLASLFLKSSLDSWPIKDLRRVDIRIEVRDYYEKGFLDELVKRACETLNRSTRLIEVRITAHRYKGLTPEQIRRVDEMADELVEVFAMVRGVENVVFSRCFVTKSRARTRQFRIAGTKKTRRRVKKIMTSKP